MEDIQKEKMRLRRWAREKRGIMLPEKFAEANHRIEAQVLALPVYQKARTVMAYISMPGEPETRGIILDAVHQGKQVLLPRCRDSKMMEAALFRGFGCLNSGRMGIPEPAGEKDDRQFPEADLIVVPCVAAARNGKRLGHGAGYYDRFLEDRSGKTVCLCYRELLLEDLPSEEWDVRMDMVLTEDELLVCKETDENAE